MSEDQRLIVSLLSWVAGGRQSSGAGVQSGEGLRLATVIYDHSVHAELQAHLRLFSLMRRTPNLRVLSSVMVIRLP